MTEFLKSKPMVEAKKAALMRRFSEHPKKLLILRDNDEPVIEKYVSLKIRFGAEIGVTVEDVLVPSAELASNILAANTDKTINGLILQLPIRQNSAPNSATNSAEKTAENATEESTENSAETPAQTTAALCNLISPQKDVDGLGQASRFMPATVKAILDLLAFYSIDLSSEKIAVVGRGKLVGAPLLKVLKAQNLAPALFHRGSNLDELKNYTLVITATGVPGLIKSDQIAADTVLVDAGTASEKGVVKGDLAPALYERSDLRAITPKIGGVGPATVACLFENLSATP